MKVTSGSVTVEPWNDFDCLRLQALNDEGIIANLTCNGTNNSTVVDGKAGLSKGAWAGIGIGIAVAVVVTITTVTWIVLYLRLLVKSIQPPAGTQQLNEKSHAALQQEQKLAQIQQLDGQGIVREKPDDHLREIYTLPAEKPDDQMHELPAGSAVPSNASS